MLRQYAPSLKHIAEIIERGIKEHPGVYSGDQHAACCVVSQSMMSLFRAQCGYDY